MAPNKWKVLIEQDYDRPADFGRLREGDPILLKDSGDRPIVAEVKQLLPPEDSGYAGTVLARFFNH